MIENIELYASDKIKLKHLSIDKNTPINIWMEKGARFILDNDPDIQVTPADDYATYTMDIPQELKQDIRLYVNKKGIKLRDFWVAVAHLIIEREGC